MVLQRGLSLRPRTFVCLKEDADVGTKPWSVAALVGKVVPTGRFNADGSEVGFVPSSGDPGPPLAPSTDAEYGRGLWTIGFCTLMFATQSPALRFAFTATPHEPPVPAVPAAHGVHAVSEPPPSAPSRHAHSQEVTAIPPSSLDSVQV